ncbi:MAG TPA: cupin domain-containing protein [Caldimonas sp.]|nr:cupin domain-containing protein [Caldimonas sp.]HEX4233373.1 cupin domain-containing protein [Caldimonas sp.]
MPSKRRCAAARDGLVLSRAVRFAHGRQAEAPGEFFGLKRRHQPDPPCPGSFSSLRHAHAKQDEFIYIVSGHPTLHTERGRTELSPGMCAGFRAGTGDGHHLHNDHRGRLLPRGRRSDGGRTGDVPMTICSLSRSPASRDTFARTALRTDGPACTTAGSFERRPGAAKGGRLASSARRWGIKGGVEALPLDRESRPVPKSSLQPPP